jgi:hypothetical protein
VQVGLIQSAGIGDIIIALPIADFYLDRGASVVWPIHEQLLPMFSAANPRVKWIGLEAVEGVRYTAPVRVLSEVGCDYTYSLYNRSHVNELVANRQLARSLKFDEYKYAIAGVPFSEKWRLHLRRDKAREQALFDRLNIDGPYVCVHDVGSNVNAKINTPPEWTERIIRVSELTDNPLDWLMVLEKASKLVMLDSCLANAVDQLNFSNDKYLVLRSSAQMTPVYRNGWRFIAAPVIQDQEQENTNAGN